MDTYMKLVGWMSDFIWGIPLIVLVVGAGIILSLMTGFIIYRRFGLVMKTTFGTMFKKQEADAGGITPFQAVSTALAATVGTGNIVGVATAIGMGGPGAIFWMWLAAIFGMTTKFAEVTLAVAYRERNELGEFSGGPMYYIRNGLGWGWLGKIFALFGALAAFGIGNMTQSNSMAAALQTQFNIAPWITGLVLALTSGVILIGGIKRIAQVTERVVPFMAAIYILGAIVIVIMNAAAIPDAFAHIFKDAFTGTAAVGGFAGTVMAQAIRYGVARGVFTNEAGLGSAPIAHAAATTDHPVRQGLWGAFEVFVDTLMICTMTALVIITSGMWTDGGLAGAALTTAAFSHHLPAGGYIVTFALLLFPFTTILGWCYYGEKSAEYLLNTSKVAIPYRALFVIIVFIGAIREIDFVWVTSDVLNGLMALPNLIGVIALSGVIVKLCKQFFADPEKVYTEADYASIVNRK